MRLPELQIEMRMKSYFSVLILPLFFFPQIVRSQEVIPLNAADITEGAITRTDTYDLEGLFTYLGGNSADLCVEFGFGSLLVQDISFGDDRIKIELFRMNSPEAAFGLYSLSIVQCVVRDSLNAYDCTNKYQYDGAYGNLYLNITSESGSEFAIRQYWILAQKLMQKNASPTLLLPEPFELPRMKASRKNLVFMGGHTALQNSLFPWQALFLGVNFAMYSIILPAPVADIYFARIKVPSQRDLTLFLGYAGLMDGITPRPNHTDSDGLYREYRQVSPDDPLTIYFLQSQEPFPIDGLIQTGRQR